MLWYSCSKELSRRKSSVGTDIVASVMVHLRFGLP